MATTQPQDTFQKTALRLPRDLHERVIASAEGAGRSMNSEIIARLEQSFHEHPNAAALREEVKHLRELADAAKHAGDLMTFHARMLAQFITELGPFLTKEQRRQPGIAVRLQLAEGVVRRDADAMAGALAQLFELQPEEAAQLKDVREDDPPESLRALFKAEPAKPARKR